MTAIGVVGGGIAGLSAARKLVLAGAEVVLIEAADRLGGKVLTTRIGPACVELGPDWFNAHTPGALELVNALDLSDELVAPARSGTAVWVDGRLVPLPAGLVRGVPASVRAALSTGLLSRRGALRAAAGLLLPGRLRGPDVSLGAFLERRLGPEVVARLVDPLLAGARAGGTAELSLAAAAPELDAAARAHRNLASGLRAAAAAAPSFYGLRAGMQRLIEALADRLGRAEVLTATRARALEQIAGGRFRVVLERAARTLDGLVLAAPAPAAARLLGPLSPAAADALAAVRYADAAVVVLVYPAGTELPEGSGFLVPSTEGRLLSAAAWYSAKWPHCAPDGSAVVRAFVTRPPGLALTDDELARRAAAEIAAAGGPSVAPRTAAVWRWRAGLPVYAVGHLERIGAAEDAIGGRPLALAGAALRGAGLSGCIASGEAAATRVLARLSGQTPVTLRRGDRARR